MDSRPANPLRDQWGKIEAQWGRNEEFQRAMRNQAQHAPFFLKTNTMRFFLQKQAFFSVTGNLYSLCTFRIHWQHTQIHYWQHTQIHYTKTKIHGNVCAPTPPTWQLKFNGCWYWQLPWHVYIFQEGCHWTQPCSKVLLMILKSWGLLL